MKINKRDARGKVRVHSQDASENGGESGSENEDHVLIVGGGVRFKRYYDGGKKLKERPVAWYDRLHNNMVGQSDGSIDVDWYPNWMREGHSDPVLSAPDASGGVYQFGGTASGFTGGFFIGMSRSDGFNLGLYGGGELNITRWGGGVTIQAASGNFTWENYKKYGTNANIGYGAVAYSYSEGGIYRTGEKSEFSMHGLSFGAGTSWFKSSPKINATTGVTYTLPFLK